MDRAGYVRTLAKNGMRRWHGQDKAGFSGSFERLGKLRLRAGDHVRSSNGWPYRVTYSPISKTVWKLEPLHPAPGTR